MATKSTAKKNPKLTAVKSQTKTKAQPKPKKPVLAAAKKPAPAPKHKPEPQPQAPAAKTHPFAAFVQTRPSHHNHPTANKFGRHDFYRKKAI